VQNDGRGRIKEITRDGDEREEERRRGRRKEIAKGRR
jgi:hypothetical protein